MIFVTVGTHNDQFNRLLQEMDNLIEKGIIKEKVRMQIGYSTYLPKYAKWFRFKDPNEISNIIKKSRIIISHGGSGTLLKASRLNKIVIGVPRLKKFGEHTNDHQLQIVRQLEKKGRIFGVYDIKKLGETISKSKKRKIKKKKEKIIMIPIINEFLNKPNKK